MKCPKCGKEWNQLNTIVSNTGICPNCGNNFAIDGTEREDINQVLLKLIDDYGMDLLSNINRLNALLMDLAPHSEKERKLLIMVMKEGILSKLTKLVNLDQAEQEFEINKCIKQLVSDIWITEAAARYATYVLAGAIGIHIVLEEGSKTESDQTKDAQKEKVLTKDLGLVSKDAIDYALKDSCAIGFKSMAANTSLENLELPNGIKYIYPKAFMNCINLKKISLPNTIKVIGTCAFEGCSSLEEISVADGSNYLVKDDILIDKCNKKVIRVFNKNINFVKIPNGITSISKKAFERSGVGTVELPMSLMTIENEAFYLALGLEKFVVDHKNKTFRAINGVLHSITGKILLYYPKGEKSVNYYLEDTVEEIGTQAFSCSVNLQSITFTNALKKIGFKAFEYCLKLENLILPGGLEIIGDRAFQYCINLKGAMLSRNILEIGDCAFYECRKLETISVPKNVKKIGNLAFGNCEKLHSVIIQENVEFIGDGAFVGCDNIEITIKDNQYVETYCNVRNIKWKKWGE